MAAMISGHKPDILINFCIAPCDFVIELELMGESYANLCLFCGRHWRGCPLEEAGLGIQ